MSCYSNGRVITVLHTFIKKTQKTPRRELATARQRLKEVKRYG
ncbi:type II toxin-antitoxin system RelE/ParE family toxin [Synechococcus sp. J7-Johnson]|nr:type II toxin-antitoxin system RelE/ParE family toxin [Synechococcus sp. J7-Johnson]MCP9840686.1 type II toxin-antitoxin system RelE/ParE family toxin [Synechococcus sp. J7-Johnson]